MYYNTPLSEIMTTELTTIGPNDILEVVDYIFKNNDFRHLPVVDEDGKILGIISKSDYFLFTDRMTFLKKGFRSEKNDRFFQSMLVEEVMTTDLARLRPDTKISVAAAIFKDNLIHAIPIVDEDDVLVGMVSTIDLINYAYNQPALNVK